MDPRISIIIRTKDEERWITQCLQGVFSQRYQPFEVILVDNESRDRTIEKAKQFPIRRVIPCTEYRPGKALNLGIRQARGSHLAFLSGHCIPVNEHWLERLLGGFDAPEIAGVYGRQEPMSFTPDADKRDLALVFGLDRKVQVKDSFFHNANSMIRRELWEQVPFDETATNIEDRIWARDVLRRGYKIVYEPEASVYHYHGIHQNGDAQRCVNVVRILESLYGDYQYKSIELERLNVVAIVPVRGPVPSVNGRSLLDYTIERALASRTIKQVVVSTDSSEVAKLAKRLGAQVPFLRDAALSQPFVDLAQVLRYSLERIEELKIFPDLVVSLEVTFPFRPQGLLDDMIGQLAREGYDSVIAAKRENRAIWKEQDGAIVQLDEGLTPRQFKEATFLELKGVGCVTHPEFLRQGSLLGDKIGIYEITNPYSHLEVRSPDDVTMASHLIGELFPAAARAATRRRRTPAAVRAV